uniref:Uncharacterized protein n=1 Tax=uncultured marine crenarchaeote E6-3G TaxID=907719 RepID=G9BAM9_9ARCH|nr:hypothetical protein E6-3G_30 [uncultured marine crenarchaeote E6-3G]
MGRITKGSMRTRLQEKMMMLRKTFRAALKENQLQDAFDQLWPAWADEQAAMIHTQVLSPPRPPHPHRHSRQPERDNEDTTSPRRTIESTRERVVPG